MLPAVSLPALGYRLNDWSSLGLLLNHCLPDAGHAAVYPVMFCQTCRFRKFEEVHSVINLTFSTAILNCERCWWEWIICSSGKGALVIWPNTWSNVYNLIYEAHCRVKTLSATYICLKVLGGSKKKKRNCNVVFLWCWRSFCESVIIYSIC